MSNLFWLSNDEVKGNEPLFHGMFYLRHKVFYEHLGWDVSTKWGMEIDGYDEQKALYIISTDGRGKVDGCWRALPTTGNYMLKDTFPELLRGELPPCEGDVWELSRFAVDIESMGSMALFNPVVLSLICSAYEYAERNNIRRYVTVTSVALEKLFRRIGFTVQRFGDQRAQKVGSVLSVACYIDMDERARGVVESIYARLSLMEQVA